MLWIIVIGFLVGIGTMMLTPERDLVGIIVALVVGMAGSTVPAVLGPAIGWYRIGDPAGIIGSLAGAMTLSCVYLALLMREIQENELPAKHASR